MVATAFLSAQPAIPRDEQVEAQVESLLSKMSLKDKVGQMCQLTFDAVASKTDNGSSKTMAKGILSSDAIRSVFGNYKVGSILNIPYSVAQSPKVWSDVIRTLNDASVVNCGGIPQIHGVDQIHGASYTRGSTLFPQEIGQGASFNKEIPYRIGQITAYETRACLIPWVFSPVMDLGRSPLWPRLWESYGEDVLTNSVMASQLTRGLQGDDVNHLGMYNVAACLKHYMAYGAAVSGKDRTPSSVTDRELMEKYFQPFRACIEAGALSIMVNSANNNGMPFHCNHKLLTEWLKEGLDWDGMIVSDWADIDNLWRRDHVAANKKEAICLAVNAGIDMSMDPYNTDFCTLLEELVNEGKVPTERIDDAVRRILRLKIRCGLFDRSTWDIPYDASPKKPKKNNRMQPRDIKSMYREFGGDGFAEEAVHMAEECQVLLKNNNNILPLKKGTKIFVCGPNADNFRPQNGGWTYTWQGEQTDRICREIGKYHTFLGAIENKFGKENVEYSPMVEYCNEGDWKMDQQVPELLIEDGNRTADKIGRADVIICCIGENSYTETPGNIDDLNLSINQIEMVEYLAKSGKPIILILNEGRPRLIGDIEPLAGAVIHTFLPGNYGGDALANLLSGEANFSARLPYTYPKYHGSFITYDCKPCECSESTDVAYNNAVNTTVQYPFGYGLSYTTVGYSNITSSVEGDKFTVTVKVSNIGNRAVKEPVLLFVSDLVASLTPDVKRLRAFEKVSLEAHEEKTVTFTLPVSDLAFVNSDLKWVVEPGEFKATIGNQSTVFSIK